MSDRKEKSTWEVGRWSPGDHCVIGWTALPEPPSYAAQYRKVAEVYDKADVPKLAAAPELYEALEDLMSAMDDVLYNADRVPDCIVAVAQDEMDKAKAALKKARGEK